MKQFVINLRRRPDRLQKFFERCPYNHETFEIVEAFDGHNVSQENKKERKLVTKFPKDRQPGAIGCSISHLRIWKKMVNENIPVAMIFEDDAHFDPNFTNFMETLEIPEEVNILFFGGRFNPGFVIPSQNMIPVNEKVYKHNDRFWNNRLHERTTHGYIIKLPLARFLIELFNISESPQPVDQFIIHCLKGIGVSVYSTYPLVCWSPIVGDSDIR